MEQFRRFVRDIDYVMIVLVIVLMVYSCLAIAGVHNPQMPSHAWLKQMINAIVGLVAMIVAAMYDYRMLRRFHWWIFGVIFVLMLAPFGFQPINGAHAWIDLKVTSLQPSEFAKIALILSIASFMADVDESDFPDYRIRTSWPIWAMLLPLFAITLLQRTLGQALVMAAIAITMFMTYTKRSIFALCFGFVLLGGTALVALPIFFEKETASFVQNIVMGKLHLLHGYQGERIMTWLDPNRDLSGTGFNVHQAQMAIASGQMFGQGAFNGLLSMNAGVPNEWTDYIFSSVGEQFGFVGSAGLVLVFLAFLYRLTRIARDSSDTFGTYIVIGVLAMFAFQVFENIGMDMYMSPSTGITLPFISYGGSSLVANFIAVGICMSVGLRYKPLRFRD